MKINTAFYYLLAGRILANIGDSLYYILTMWLVYDITKDAFYTGIINALIITPKIIQFLYGPIIDRINLKKVLIYTQIIQFILILIIATMKYYDYLNIYLLFIVVPIASLVSEFGYPAQTRLIPELLNKDDLVKGNSMMATANQGVDIIFNSISGILISIFSVTILYFSNTIFFLLAFLIFSKIKYTSKKDHQFQKDRLTIKNYLHLIKEGFILVKKSLLWVLILGSATINFAIGMIYTLLPIYAHQYNDPKIYGYLLASMSCGLIIGAIISNYFKKYKLGPLCYTSFFISFCLWCLAPFFNMYIFIILFSMGWISIGLLNVILASASQQVIPRDKLARVDSIKYSLGVITMPVGGVVGGMVTKYISVEFSFILSSIFFLFISLLWILHKDLRILPSQLDLKSTHLKIE
ncbi:MFS transporter [Macrococcus hajekii]|uniref:MFS transporter n=1 Tax=Macrococcus hajekii TaxID=198482 RepID=A0A4V6PPN0_9STAP|nr:MFS transporter [Macrococcus hajekii]TDM01012.1 MFS transporter [Macrococcus hajekii]GGB13168.1 MFS transporter [Macrococcus hajekii]